MKHPALEQDALGQGRLVTAVHRLLGGDGGQHRLPGDLLGRIQGVLDQLLGRNDTADQPAAFGLFGTHEAAGQVHVHRFGLADEPGQALGAAHAGNHPQVDFGLAEFGRVGGDDEIAGHRQLATPAQRVSGHRRDDRLADVHQPVGGIGKQVLGKHIAKALARHFLDVGPGGKGLFRSGQDNAAHLVIGVRFFQRLAQLAQHLGVQGVQGVGAVQPDQGNVVFHFNGDRLIGHEFCSRLFRSWFDSYHERGAVQVIFGIARNRKLSVPPG